MIFRRTKFQIEGLTPDVFIGFDSGREWNGFSVPAVTYPVACEFIAAYNAANADDRLTIDDLEKVEGFRSLDLYRLEGFAFVEVAE